MAAETEEHVAALYKRSDVAKTILVSFVVIVALSMLSLLVFNSVTAKATRKDQTRALRVLIECTTAPALRVPPEHHVPASDCYSRQQKATTSFTSPESPLASLVSAAAACGAAHPNDIPNTLKCVLDALK